MRTHRSADKSMQKIFKFCLGRFRLFYFIVQLSFWRYGTGVGFEDLREMPSSFAAPI